MSKQSADVVKGKRFLITQPMIQEMVGSTMVALELADYLVGEGADVLVYTHYLSEPAATLFRDRNIEMTDDPTHPKLQMKNFDYIWVHSQVIPESIIREFEGVLPKRMPKFIFLHMSMMDWFPDEKSYIWMLEENISSKTLFAWKDVQDKQLGELLVDTKLDLGIYQNPAPKKFSELKKTSRKKLKSIILIGNQLPPEVLKLQEMLNNAGYNAVRYSASGDKYDVITPELLAKYDVVITGSKSVYYSLCAGIPVYIYNYFGCEGYLTSENLEDSIQKNFSGRGYEMQPPEYAFNDLVDNYKNAVDFSTENREYFIENFSIHEVLPRILKSIKNRKIQPFEKKYARMVIENTVLSRRLFFYENEKFKLQKSVMQLEEKNSGLSGELEVAKAYTSGVESRLDELLHSKSYRFGRAVGRVAQPVKTVADIVRKK